MENKENQPQESYEEILKRAQEETMQAVYGQLQAIYGNMPGVEIPGMGDLQAQLEAQMKAAVPDPAQLQALQAAMGAPGGMPPGMGMPEGMAQQNMAFANACFQALQEEEADGGGEDWEEEGDAPIAIGEEDLWDIEHADAVQLAPQQLHLLAFGAPLFVYNSEEVDSTGSNYGVEVTRGQMEDWWGIVDRDTTWECVHWLLQEGHHATADRILGIVRDGGTEALERAAEADGEIAEKAEDVLRMMHLMQRLGCPAEELPETVIAWDLVRVANVGRWTFHCGYLSEEEMWQVMDLARQVACRRFASWQEYGRSFAMGRGVWHGEGQDCVTAYEIIETLLRRGDSPWNRLPFREA